MAQRILPYLLAQQLWEQQSPAWSEAERDRFLLGSVLPDAVAHPRQRLSSHYVVLRPDKSNYFDFAAFRSAFPEHCASDPLYGGYYLHLVVDALYRHFLRSSGTHALLLHPRDMGRLQRDYHLLNHYLTQTYRLENHLTCPAELCQEPLLAVANFAVEPFLAAMAADFTEDPPGETYYLTEELVEEFLANSLPLCRSALDAVREGEDFLSPTELLLLPGE